MLSQRGRYALKALLNITRANQGARPVTVISEEENIPRKFLELIMGDLRRAGLVKSVRGNLGGYRLARPADLITFADVVRATDGPIAMLPCVSRNFYQRCDDCVDETECALRRVFSEVRDSVNGVLEQRTLAGAVLGERPASTSDDEAA